MDEGQRRARGTHDSSANRRTHVSLSTKAGVSRDSDGTPRVYAVGYMVSRESRTASRNVRPGTLRRAFMFSARRH